MVDTLSNNLGLVSPPFKCCDEEEEPKSIVNTNTSND